MSKLVDFSTSKVTYNKPKKHNGMYLSKANYTGKEITIQLKRKITLSGVYREGNKYYIDLLFNTDNEKDKNFIKMYKKLEMLSIKEIYKKYNEWMGVEDKLEFEEIYTSFRSHLGEEDNIKRIQFNLITNKNMMDTQFYNESLEKVAYKQVEEGDELSLILTFDGIKFGKERFENYWKVLQVKIYDKIESVEEEIKEIEKKERKDEFLDISDEESIEKEESVEIDIEDLKKMDLKIQEKYKKYREEESLNIID